MKPTYPRIETAIELVASEPSLQRRAVRPEPDARGQNTEREVPLAGKREKRINIISHLGAIMNKTELFAAVADKAGMTKAQAGAAIDAALQAIQEALANGDEVRIVGFGSFAVNQRAAGEGRNPRTGEKILMPARNVPSFKAGVAFKEAVNK
jgi:DNA-binding protein HU-beta